MSTITIANTPVNYTSYSQPPSTTGANSEIQQLLQEINQLIGNNGGGSLSPSIPSIPATPTTSSPSSVTSSYNQLMTDLSANGTSKQTLQNDASAFLAASNSSGGGTPDVNNAVNDMVKSLSDGTFSQQGSQGTLEGAASKDGLQGVLTPQINGNFGMQDQNAGDYDANSSYHTGPGAHGSLGANADVLFDEMRGGAPTSQIINNATALRNQATNAGDTGVANVAQNIINSIGDGTYNAAASDSALNAAVAAAPSGS